MFNKADVARVPGLSEVKEKLAEGGVLSELMEQLLSFLEVTTASYRTIEVSALKGVGIDTVVDAVREVFCSCGDLS